MKKLKQSWNNMKAANLEANALNCLYKKKYDKFYSLIPKWEDYEFLRIEGQPALLKIIMLEEDQLEAKETLLEKFSALKYRTKAVNCDKNNLSASPYHLTVLNGQLELADRLNSWGGNPKQILKHGNTLLHAAVLHGCSVDTLQYILDRKVELDATNEAKNTAVHLLCYQADEERLNFFIKKRANFNTLNH